MKQLLPTIIVVVLVAALACFADESREPLVQPEPLPAVQPDPAEEGEDELAKAREALAKEKQARVERVRQKITAALEEDRCDLVVGMLVTPSGNIPQVTIVAKD